MKKIRIIIFFLIFFILSSFSVNKKINILQGNTILKAVDFKHYADYFNRMEEENIVQAIPNSQSWEWMEANIPLFACPQDNFEEIYYYRWWTLRKHIQKTQQGFTMTEFLVSRKYADKYNMISCAVGHHILESRWLHNKVYIDDYIHLWYRGNEGKPMQKLHKFSNWTSYALYQRYLVNDDKSFLTNMLPDLINDYDYWEKNQRLSNGLFWQYDVRDGMEEQISGGRKVKNARPTINSYMYGNAIALSEISALTGDKKLANNFKLKADTIKKLVMTKLWNPDSSFFETVKPDSSFAQVREAIGYLPWYVNLPDEGYETAWKQVDDPNGFLAPFGITTAERRHPEFRSHGCCHCEWDGAIWPFATSQTLTAMANLINNYDQDVINGSVYFKHLELYVESSYYRGRPYIGEYLDETTGYWLKGDQERSRYYNHSTFNDLIISGLIGLHPRPDNILEVSPIIPQNQWDWFCLDNVLYHNKIITIVWDKDGTKFDVGKGFHIFVNGIEVAKSDTISKIICEL